MDVGLHRPARIPEAVCAETLPPLTIDDRPLGLHLAREQRCERGGAGGLARELRARVEEAERVLDLLLGDEHPLDPAAELDRDAARERGVQAVRDRPRLDRDGRARGERRMQGLARLRLDRDDANAPGRAERGDDPADEPAAADGDGDDVGVGRVLLDLEPDRAGARDHDRVVERMHERPAALGEQLLEAIERLGRPRRLEVDRRAVAAGGRDLLLGGAVPHHDERVHPALGGGVCDRLGVVARRDRDHAARPLVRVERAQLVQRAARLERAGPLQELALEAHAEGARAEDRRARQAVADDGARAQDVVAANHAGAPPRRARRPRPPPR